MGVALILSGCRSDVRVTVRTGGPVRPLTTPASIADGPGSHHGTGGSGRRESSDPAGRAAAVADPERRGPSAKVPSAEDSSVGGT